MNGLYLGIDTSCYTTSIACVEEKSIVLDERTVLSVPLGGRGLRQSDGLFQHNRNLPALLKRLYASVNPKRIAGVGVSAAPTGAEQSYMPVFLAGILTAEAIAGALSVPLVRTTHQRGHLRAAMYGGNEMLLEKARFLALHVSGGTTDVLEVTAGNGLIDTVRPLGCSTDLHAGQMVDRLGVALGLPFPAGKRLEALAGDAEEKDIRLPSSVRDTSCSLSGAESQAQRLLQGGAPAAEVAYAVYDCLARTLVKLIHNAAQETGCDTALVSGGVASSLLLRRLVGQRNRFGLEIRYGESRLSSDNAVGVAFDAKESLCSRKP